MEERDIAYNFKLKAIGFSCKFNNNEIYDPLDNIRVYSSFATLLYTLYVLL